MQLNTGSGYPSSVLKWTSQVLDDRSGKEASLFLGKAATIAWHIWKSRNEFIFKHVPVNPKATMLG